MRLGIDVGSTTVKLICLDDDKNVIYSRYERHMSNVFEKVEELLNDLLKEKGDLNLKAVISGSGGLSLADLFEIKFEQEVIASSEAVDALIPQTDVSIELGGEDAKITYFGGAVEQRMNGTCAGGTGAFIDQMAVLLKTDAEGLNEAAKNYKTIYPIASRCGVYAKTDLQPLINDGAATEDLAVSIFQSVTNQTIGGLACGHPIKGKVAFLGGPLTYLSELRKRFIETLNLSDDEIIFPENSKYFVAIGAAYLADEEPEIKLSKLIAKIKHVDRSKLIGANYLEPMFKGEEDYEEFKERHAKAKINRNDIKKAKGPLFLGIDAGSTTTKAALINEDKELIFEHYQGNEGHPLEVVKNILKELYSKLPEDAYIGRSVVTGYGEGLIKAGFKVDVGEIETIAHYKGAEEFLPGVDFILDIGGQDMKCMKIKDGAIYNIMLNESCSSGCGSFIETYAKSVDMSVNNFAKEALKSKKPVDLGTRCTVFMNSKVKQAQKEGSTVADISAGLSVSVIKNALYKVIKLRNSDDAGQNIVVQGGTFLNDSVLRSIEKVLGRNVIRPEIAGLMGAFGAAIIACDGYTKNDVSGILTKDKLDSFTVKNSNARCGKCGNNCLLTISKFADGTRYITGNRCEKGAGLSDTHSSIPNLYEQKRELLFNRKTLTDSEAVRGEIGLPRVLNMYENYPFWNAFFNKLKFKVVLSPASTKKFYEDGMDTIPSDTVCYPAKLVHGHIKWLVNNGVKRVFYPSINYEVQEDPSAPNHYNCPIVATYPEVIDKNMADFFFENNAEYYHPFIPYDSDDRLVEEFYKFFNGKRDIDIQSTKNIDKIYNFENDTREYDLFEQNISRTEIREAVRFGRLQYNQYREDVKNLGLNALKYIKDNNKKGIILAGRPYHLDPEINHGIDKVVNELDMVVLTEDSVIDGISIERPIRILDQWVYHARLYKAAIFAGTRSDVEIIQLNSFGCGLDAVTTDEVEELLEKSNKLYTCLKIDEGSNLGAARIRIRSLKAAMEERKSKDIIPAFVNTPYERAKYTKKMKTEGYTLLVPQMSPIHFQYFEPLLRSGGYNPVLLPPVTKSSEEEGLKYVNNDACYPTIVTLGQILAAVKSGKYDVNKLGIFMSQTGGPCRASNYVSLLRKALRDLDLPQIPVVSFNNKAGLETNPGFKIDVKLSLRLVIAVTYGDLFMKCLYRTRPYEKVKGSAQAIMDSWYDKVIKNILTLNKFELKKNLFDIVKEYDELPLLEISKPRVGIVGEILVKYHPNANANIVEQIEAEGGEAVVPSFIDFFEYGMYSKKFDNQYLNVDKKTRISNTIQLKAAEYYRNAARQACRSSKRFVPDAHIEETAENASKIISLGNQCGEGWLLTGEMVDLINNNVKNILCLQPFACLPNHVTGKGMIKAMRNYDPDSNIVAIDYDPGASNVNQLNRIKLMMATALKKNEESPNSL